MVEHRDMGGVLFRDTKKEKENQPDYRGDITINGVTYKLAGWLKEGRKGKFLSLAVSKVGGK